MIFVFRPRPQFLSRSIRKESSINVATFKTSPVRGYGRCEQIFTLFSVSREIDSGAVHGMRHRELVCRSSVRVRAAGQRLAGEAWAGGESSDAPPLAGPVSPLIARW